MIKLIASDLDGTLVPEETSVADPELFTCIRDLKNKGILFAAASGRQYASILKVFAPLKDEIIFIADNGGYVIEHDRILYRRTFDVKTYQDIVRFILETADVNMMISSVEGDYTNCRDMEFIKFINDTLGMDLEPVPDLASLEINVSKVALYSDRETKAMIRKEGIKRFGEAANILDSSEHWMDFIPKSADKGAALKWLQQNLSISPRETMCFGDRDNDIGMLKRAEESYAVAGASSGAKAAAKYVMSEGPEDNGVIHILNGLLRR